MCVLVFIKMFIYWVNFLLDDDESFLIFIDIVICLFLVFNVIFGILLDLLCDFL